MVGDGVLRPELESYVKAMNLDGVRLMGFANQYEMMQYYNIADIFILTSYNENWGLVINEAMNSSCAVITSDQVGSSFDLVVDGLNGYVITELTPERLSGAISDCINKNKYENMGKMSSEIIKKWGIKENIIGFENALRLLKLI
jgi:glycosyltransferase involved in cell wall biosynthesis